MKKLVLVLALTSLLSACGGSPVSLPFVPTPRPVSSPQPTVTPFALEATNTPDLFALSTSGPTTTPSTETPRVADTPLPTFTATVRPTITLEAINPSLFTPSSNIFLSVQRSTDLLVWGGSCQGARSILFTAQLLAAKPTRYVTLWYRLQDKYSGRHTDWGGGAIMSRNDQGSYFYNLELGQIQSYRNYLDAWFQYQLIASTATQKVIGRSVVSRGDVSLAYCGVLNP